MQYHDSFTLYNVKMITQKSSAMRFCSAQDCNWQNPEQAARHGFSHFLHKF